MKMISFPLQISHTKLLAYMMQVDMIQIEQFHYTNNTKTTAHKSDIKHLNHKPHSYNPLKDNATSQTH
jgi:hypothetical protein